MDELRHVQSTESRLRLLFLLEELGSATREQLWVLVARLNLMDYIPFGMHMQELLEQDVIWAPKGIDGLLALTADGLSMLNSLMHLMPKSDRKQMASAAAVYHRELLEEESCTIFHEAPKDGMFGLRCSVSDGEEPLLELSIRSVSSDVTDAVAAGFRDNAPFLLQKLYILESEKETDCKKLEWGQAYEYASLHPGEAVCAFDADRFAGVITLKGEKALVFIALWHFSEQDAKEFARTAAELGGKLADEIIEVVSSGIPQENA